MLNILFSEEQIERKVERAIDRLDAALMSGKLTQAEYDVRVKSVNEWADDSMEQLEQAKIIARLSKI
jgi:hypothetical protein